MPDATGTPDLEPTPRQITVRVPIEPVVLSIPDTATILGGITERYVYYLLGEKELEGVKIGCRRMVLLESVRALVERRREGGSTTGQL